jgi:hypothetical protein
MDGTEAPDPADSEDEPDDLEAFKADFEAKDGALDAARAVFAQASINKRSHWRKRGKRTKALEESYNQAKQAYEAAQVAAGASAVEYLQGGGIEGDNLKASVMQGIIGEKLKFSQTEHELLENDGSRRGKISRWMAKHRIIANIMLGSGATIAGATTGMAFRALKWSAAATGPVGFAVGIATKMLGAGRHIALGRAKLIRDFEARGNADIQALQEKVQASNINVNEGAGGLATKATGMVVENVDTRAEKDLTKNRSDVATAALFAGVMGVAGAALGSFAADHFISQPSPPVQPKLPEDNGEFRKWLIGISKDYYEKNGIKTPSPQDQQNAFNEAVKAMKNLSNTKPSDLSNLARAVQEGPDPYRLFDGTKFDNLYRFFGGKTK